MLDKEQEYQLPDVVDGFASEGLIQFFLRRYRQRLQYLCIGRVESLRCITSTAVKKMR